MKNYSTRSSEEAMTYQLFAEHFADENNWTSAKAAVANTFKAMWTASLPADKVHAVTVAMSSIAFEEASVQKALTALVRAKVLRSHRHSGRTFYEVNY